MFTMKSLACLLVAVSLYNIQLAQAVANSGPYDVIPRRLEYCEDQGTNEVILSTLRMNSKSKKIKTYTGSLTLKYDWDNHTGMIIEAQRQSNGIYRPRFFQKTLNTCDQFWIFGKDFLTDLFASSNYTFTGCPLPAGTYTVKDWVLKININNLPVFVYGSYKVIFKTIKAGNIVSGCFNAFADVVPK